MTMRKFIPGRIVKDAGLGPREIRVIGSTATQDRVGDIVEPRGCDMRAYLSNPIALANHDPTKPIGTARPAIVSNRLEATIVFAPAGLSAVADEWCGLAKAGVITGVSIGFNPIEYEPLPSGAGTRFTKWELLEISLVAVPANAEALIVERSHHASFAKGTQMLSPIRELMHRLDKCEFHHVDALDVADEAHDGGLDPKEALVSMRKAVERSRVHLNRAAEICRKIRDGDDGADNEELAFAPARRKAKLDRLDGADVGRRSAPAPAVREIGGAHLTAELREQAQAAI